MKFKSNVISVVALVTLFTLTGCSSSAILNSGGDATKTVEEKVDPMTNKTGYNPSEVNSFEYELPNGEKVFCIFAEGITSGESGLWCTPDFESQE